MVSVLIWTLVYYAELQACISIPIQLKYLAEETQLEKVIQELTASENDGPMSETFCQVQSKCFNQIQLIQTSKF
jgi:hypothetical protein